MAQQDIAMYADSVSSQRENTPSIYGEVDFSKLPERYINNLEAVEKLPPKYKAYAQDALSDPGMVGVIRDATMTGDRVADNYAALIPEYGFRTLVTMLDEACEKGVEHVTDAPKELITFIHAMEATPEWVDMDMIERGARMERIPLALSSSYIIRGAFVATFLNKYTALPMVMTGTLSDSKAARRVFETASFFTATAMPGALSRFGGGFKAAAKVRLMHSMVRYNIMKSGKWDVATYGIPIPQVDQMPAGLIGVFLLSFKLLAKGRVSFTPDERARVEMARYRCFLLGLPQNLLGETPQEIVNLIMARTVSLKEEFDDETCGELVRGTMMAELSDDPSLRGRLHRWMERGFSKYFLIHSFFEGDASRAEALGIPYNFQDRLAAGVTMLAIVGGSGFFKLGMSIPGLRSVLDRRLVRKLSELLDSYGHADFITDASQYKPATAKTSSLA